MVGQGWQFSFKASTQNEMIKLVTFTDDRMTISANKCVQSAMTNGADGYSLWTLNDLSAEFKEIMADVLKHERGAGFYCWKSFVCNEEIKKLNDGDFLIWSDAGTTWIRPLSILTGAMNEAGEDVLFFSNGWPHRDWCKADCIKEMLPDRVKEVMPDRWFIDLPESLKQVQASHIIFRVCDAMKELVYQWLWWTLQPGMVDNNPSIIPNIGTFQEHRWDQSIICNLQIKYGYPLHWFPSTYGHHLKDQHSDNYPAMFEHHRKRNNEWP